MRRSPPLWILLDVLMLWVLALMAQVQAPGTVSYRFLAIPQGAVLFRVEQPLRPEQRRWSHFDFGAGHWVDSETLTPHGRENFLCEECARFLPAHALTGSAKLMVGLPAGIRARIHDAFFAACAAGDCRPTLAIDAAGQVHRQPQA